jgi:hypothetical protein
MSAALLDELPSGFVVADKSVCPQPTRAKAANSANRKQPCRSTADSALCERLRKSANSQDDTQNSQEFAAVRKTPNEPGSQYPCGFSQDSQDSQGLPTPKTAPSCLGCANLRKPGTCGESVAAGLRTLDEGFGIVWPPDEQGATCPAYINKVPGLEPQAPNGLAPHDAERCHTLGWDESEIAAFTARRNRLMRWGWAEPQADAVAERLTLRDRDGDDRITCTECSAYRPGRCGNHRRTGLGTADVGRDLATMSQRCLGSNHEPHAALQRPSR